MNPNENKLTSRRQFLKATGGVAAVSTLAGVSVPAVHAAGSEEISVALVGCGGRGSGAALQAINTQKQGPVKLVAMADAFQDRLMGSYNGLSQQAPKHVDVGPDRRFIGFEAYKEAMDTLKPGDVVILTTPPAFRWVHYQYAIQKGLNVFMEKPVTTDGFTARKMLELNKEAEKKGLRVGVGLNSRHQRGIQELKKRVMNGDIGEILMMRGYRMHGPVASFQSPPKPANMSEVEYQIRRFHSFLWASGGCFNDFYIHIIDHLSWMKGSWPVKAQGLGGRHYRTTPEGVPLVDQNFDAYSVEYTYADGTKFFFDGRCQEGANGIFSSYIHGTKGSAIASRSGDCGQPSAIFKDQNMSPSSLVWEAKDNTSGHQNEWDDLMQAIRADRPYNEVRTGVEASLTSSMGRKAAHSGQEVTFQEMLNDDHVFAPNVDKMTKDGPAPVMSDANGRYPVPEPGRKGKREY